MKTYQELQILAQAESAEDNGTQLNDKFFMGC